MSIFQGPIIALFRVLLALMLVLYFHLGTMEMTGTLALSVNDLLAHGIAYWALVLMALLAFPASAKRSVLRTFLVLLLCLSYSFFIECVQHLLPYRSFSLLDILANGAGCIAGWLSHRALVRRFCEEP